MSCICFVLITLRNKTDRITIEIYSYGITKERNPFEFDFNNNYDTKEQMFLKDELKHVFEVSKKNIRFKNITNIAILQNCQFGKQMGMVAYLQQKCIFIFIENIFKFNEKNLKLKKIYLYSIKYICIQ